MSFLKWREAVEELAKTKSPKNLSQELAKH